MDFHKVKTSNDKLFFFFGLAKYGKSFQLFISIVSNDQDYSLTFSLL